MRPSKSPTVDLVGPFEYRFPATAMGARLARQVLALWLEEQPVPRDDAFDLLVACAELCANAVSHGGDDGGGSVALAARVEGDGICIEVHDDGRGFTLHGKRRADPDAESGRGLQLVADLTDHLEVRMSDDHTVVRCYKGDLLERSAEGERDLAGEQASFRRQP